MKLIHVGKAIEAVKKIDPNADDADIFAALCCGCIKAKNEYRGSEALTEAQLPTGLLAAVKQYFATHKHDGYVMTFTLVRLERSNINESVIYAVPDEIYEELDIDETFDKGLAEIGRRHGVRIALPWYCYGK